MKSKPAPVWIGWLGETRNPGLGLLVDLYYWVRKTVIDHPKTYFSEHLPDHGL
jgi:hypothetical protein